METKDNNLQNNEDRRYKVYVYTNKVNGKKYVGQTSYHYPYLYKHKNIVLTMDAVINDVYIFIEQ